MADLSAGLKKKYFGAKDDIPKKGLIGTIQKAYEHEFEQDGVTKVIVEFLEHDQSLVCNKTRLRTLIEEFGSDGDGWVGKRIKMTTASTSMGPTIVVESLEVEEEEGTEVSFEE